MLVNQANQQVNIPAKFNSKEHPNMFKNLVEKKEPRDPYHGTMFSLQERARFVQVGQRDF